MCALLRHLQNATCTLKAFNTLKETSGVQTKMMLREMGKKT